MDFGLPTTSATSSAPRASCSPSAPTPERVREHAEAGRTDDALWRELCELGWPGIAIAEEHGGQGLGVVELAILLRGAGPHASRPCRSCRRVLAATLIEHAGSDEQRARWLPGLASGELTGARRRRGDGIAGSSRRRRRRT